MSVGDTDFSPPVSAGNNIKSASSKFTLQSKEYYKISPISDQLIESIFTVFLILIDVSILPYTVVFFNRQNVLFFVQA
jgi:hypothetical protein